MIEPAKEISFTAEDKAKLEELYEFYGPAMKSWKEWKEKHHSPQAIDDSFSESRVYTQ